MTTDEMDRIAAALPSKAAKARALNVAGVSTGDISRYLGIRYQQVYNVLLRAGAISKGEPADEATAPVGEVITGRIKRDGGISLPKAVLERFGLDQEGTLYCRVSNDGLVLLSQDAARRAVTEAIREKMPEQAALLDALFSQPFKPGEPIADPPD